MKLTDRKWAKVSALFVLILSTAMVVFGVFSIIGYQSLEMDRLMKTDVLNSIYTEMLNEESDILVNRHLAFIGSLTEETINIDSKRFSGVSSNYVFRVYNGAGTMVASNYPEGIMNFTFQKSYNHPMSQHAQVIDTYTVESGLNHTMAKLDKFKVVSWVVDFMSLGLVALGLFTLVSIALMIYSFRFLIHSLGRRYGFEGIALRRVDRLPLEPMLLLYGVVTLFCWRFISGDVVQWIVFAGLALVIGLMLDVLVSLILRYKSRTLLTNTLVYRAYGCLRETYPKLPIIKRAMYIYGAYVVLEFIVFLELSQTGLLLFWFVKSIVIGVGLVRVLLDMRALETTAEILSLGNIDHFSDTSSLLAIFKKHGQNLNAMRDSVETAVADQTKSERMKTELITNVSHDIKTPLTSILNFVDLISKETIENETVVSYLEPLNRQSQKLAKLVDDLLVASHVNSGSVEVNFEVMKLNVFVEQSAGEFMDRLAAKNLQLVISGTEDEIEVLADRQFMSRTLDNLLSNVLNYSLEHSRVYLSLEGREGQVHLVVRNISKEPIDVDGSDLLERFVRGDSSRNTSGNGLGLSIAKSMVELQKGTFDLSVDGDLFKVTCTFNIKQ